MPRSTNPRYDTGLRRWVGPGARAAARRDHAVDAVGQAIFAEAVLAALSDAGLKYQPVWFLAHAAARRAHGAALRAVAAAAPAAPGRAATRAWGYARTASRWGWRAFEIARATGIPIPEGARTPS
jgi:hypothetical protein